MMKLSETNKHYLLGAVGGALVLAMVTSSWDLMLTPGAAERLGKKRADDAVAHALAPFCVAKFQSQKDVGQTGRAEEAGPVPAGHFHRERRLGHDARQQRAQFRGGQGLRRNTDEVAGNTDEGAVTTSRTTDGVVIDGAPLIERARVKPLS